jgi:hypothetical protein
MAGNHPPVRVEPDARGRIRHELAAAGRRIAVLDDDPSGSQTVHVAVVTCGVRKVDWATLPARIR